MQSINKSFKRKGGTSNENVIRHPLKNQNWSAIKQQCCSAKLDKLRIRLDRIKTVTSGGNKGSGGWINDLSKISSACDKINAVLCLRYISFADGLCFNDVGNLKIKFPLRVCLTGYLILGAAGRACKDLDMSKPTGNLANGIGKAP